MKTVTSTLVLLLLAATAACVHAADTPAIFLARGDVTTAAVEMNNSKRATVQTSLKVTLTPKKQAEFAKFTAANKGKKTRLFVNGKLWGEPFINDVVNSRTMSLSVDTPEHALTMAKKLLKTP